MKYKLIESLKEQFPQSQLAVELLAQRVYEAEISGDLEIDGISLVGGITKATSEDQRTVVSVVLTACEVGALKMYIKLELKDGAYMYFDSITDVPLTIEDRDVTLEILRLVYVVIKE